MAVTWLWMDAVKHWKNTCTLRRSSTRMRTHGPPVWKTYSPYSWTVVNRDLYQTCFSSRESFILKNLNVYIPELYVLVLDVWLCWHKKHWLINIFACIGIATSCTILSEKLNLLLHYAANIIRKCFRGNIIILIISSTNKSILWSLWFLTRTVEYMYLYL